MGSSLIIVQARKLSWPAYAKKTNCLPVPWLADTTTSAASMPPGRWMKLRDLMLLLELPLDALHLVFQAEFQLFQSHFF
jgi:hypothetical protein